MPQLAAGAAHLGVRYAARLCMRCWQPGCGDTMGPCVRRTIAVCLLEAPNLGLSGLARCRECSRLYEQTARDRSLLRHWAFAD